MLVSLDPTRAAEIGSKFFEQYHSNVIVKEVKLEGNVWLVSLSHGLIDKQNSQVKIDARTGMILGYSLTEIEKMSNEMLAVDDAVRYVIATDDKGNSLFSKIKSGKMILFKSKDQISMISSELRTLRELLKFHDEDLGNTDFVHLVREKVHILIYFLRGLTICVSCEREADNQKVLEISEKLAQRLKNQCIDMIIQERVRI